MVASLGLILLLSASAAASDADSAPSKVFTSTNRSFRFHYSPDLILCRQSSGSSGSWSPQSSCMSYIPICGNTTGAGRTFACVALPAKTYPGSNFKAAAFSVSELNLLSETDCAAGPPGARSSGSFTINGTKYQGFDASDAGAGNFLDDHAYRVFHGSTCYELNLRIATTNFANYDPGSIKEFTAADKARVESHLKQVLDSFRFLK